MAPRPEAKTLIGKDPAEVPMSAQRVIGAARVGERHWIGPADSATIPKEEADAYEAARKIMIRLAIEAPLAHKSGHPGGPLSAFTFAYEVNRRRDPAVDHPMRVSAGHLSLLAYHLEWLFGRDRGDPRLASPEAILKTFRTPSGLPGHVEAGVGDIPFGTGPLGKGMSNGLGVAFALQYAKKSGTVDVLLADGDSQEGQVAEALRLASHLKLDQLVVHGDWNDIQLSGLPSETVASDFAAIAAAAGWTVIEVQNGNDLAQVRAANDLADSFVGKGSPIFVCYYTTMGHGVPLMEEGSNTGKKNFHGAPLSKDEAEASLAALDLPSLADLAKACDAVRLARKETFEAALAKRESARLHFTLPKSYARALMTEKGAARKEFGATHLKALMDADPRIVVLHADLAGSGGFDAVEKAHPGRVINVGVAEANMYMMAAGMRQAGLLPVTYTFAAFGTNEARANARLIDINTGHIPLGVLHDCTHAGLSVGEDGETHQERNYCALPFDHTQVWVPGDSNQAGAMAERAMELIAEGSASVYVFSPRSGHPQFLKGDGTPLYDAGYRFDGTATTVAGHDDQRDEATILSYGIALHACAEAAKLLEQEGRHVRVVNMASVRPLDAAAVLRAAFETQHLVVVEDHNVEGGLATQIADLIADVSLPCTLARIGVRHYFPSGTSEELHVMAGIEPRHIADTVEDQFSHRLAGGEDAFVSCVYGLASRLSGGRFVVTARPFVEKLRSDDGYMTTLRELWKLRAIDPKEFPSNDVLKKQLANMPKEDAALNPLTGTELPTHHDPGIS